MDAGQDPRGTETLEGEVIKGDLSHISKGGLRTLESGATGATV